MSLQECLEFGTAGSIFFSAATRCCYPRWRSGPRRGGSTYNYCAPLYHKIIAAYQAGDLATAQALQMKSVKLVQVLLRTWRTGGRRRS